MSQQNEDLIDQNLIQHWKSMKKRPKIIVFDLDYTLWPYYVDCHATPPIKRTSQTTTFGTIKVIDSTGLKMNGFKDVNKILYTLKYHCLNESKNEYLAIASRSTTPDLAMETIEALGWTKYFSSFQIYPKTKTNHMRKILEELKMTSYEDILFFDDEIQNIKQTSSLKLTAIEIDPSVGTDMKTLIHGLEVFETKNKKH
ncbi:magnesium-dependent phosphatase 1-like [Brachionus plicatilis]|uniref:Magnesium-dependent phosphatase 1-like n=1 Tax=Brachionus plicatilis TaxID=10195 RepID=A0A3M7S3F6_BRAPC|nr:magnesium-dependent phosphatase 1-like [Brachionus plicatilis]